MEDRPLLSIVAPMREGVPEEWLHELLKTGGNTEFILVYPAGVKPFAITDARLRQIISPLRGEVIQRVTALLNARGAYVLSVNCDEYVHPDIERLASVYFKRFPDCWVVRLARESFAFGDNEIMQHAWSALPDVDGLDIVKKGEPRGGDERRDVLQELPIAPLRNSFNIGCVFGVGRRDHRGAHIENFDKKIWKNCVVQEALADLIRTMIGRGPIKYIPFWALDRLLGLFVQAKFYKAGLIIGHWMPHTPAQIRIEDNPPGFQRSKRFYVAADILLLKRFPQYGYFWNLVFDQLWAIPKRAVGYLGRKLFGHRA